MTEYELEDRNSISGRSKSVLRRLQPPIKVPRPLFWNPSGLCLLPAERKSAGFKVTASSEGSVREIPSTVSQTKDKNDTDYSLYFDHYYSSCHEALFCVLCPANDGTINILKPGGFFTYHQV